MITEGHAVEQACLYCADKKVLISADQILPQSRLTSVSRRRSRMPIHSTIFDVSSVLRFACRYIGFSAATKPFRAYWNGLIVCEASRRTVGGNQRLVPIPLPGIDVLNKMFTRKLMITRSLLSGSMAHFNRLMHQSRISRSLSPEGIYLTAKERNEKRNRAMLVPSAVSNVMVDEIFDYVVIGAGTAGCVVAGRLSESGKFRVCVLRPDHRTVIHSFIPAGVLHTLRNPDINWMYKGLVVPG